MQIPILIEPVAENGFRACGGEPYALGAQGATRDEVGAKLQEQLQVLLHAGAEAVTLHVPEPAAVNPLD